MKLWSAIIALSLCVCVLTAQAALPQPDLLLKIHFAGAQKIAAAPNASVFTTEFCSPEALALRGQTATKLSAWLAGWLQTNLNGNAAGAAVPGGAAKLRPLLDDLQTSEFFLEIRAANNNSTSRQVEGAIAIRLDPARAQLWQASLKPFFAAAAFKSVGGWLIFDSNPALLGLGDKVAQRISAPPADWFDVDVNWPRIAQWHPLVKELALPETQFTVTAPDNDFRVSGKFFFPQSLALNLEPWRMPTNTIHVPFDSFTAVRGFASWWQSQPWAQPYQISPAPNQFFVWSLPWAAFQNFAAIPVPNAASALSQAYGLLGPVFSQADAAHEVMPTITPEIASNEITFNGLPWAALKLRALTGPAGQFLYGETLPNVPKSKPLPPELYQRLATPNLVLYHYEMTGSRIAQLLQPTQLGLMTTRHKQLGATSTAFKWLENTNMIAKLGPTDTEITQSGPAEFTFARKTPAIFTGLEMYALANWLEATNFPGFDIKLPPRRDRVRAPYQKPLQIPLIPR